MEETSDKDEVVGARARDGSGDGTAGQCKELFRPFKKSLRKLHFPQDLSVKKEMKNVKESLTIIGDRIELFVQQYCRPLEVKHWQRMLWRFVSLFSEKDEKQLQKLYKYLKNNQVDKFKQLCCPSENPHSVPGLEEEKVMQPYKSRNPSMQEPLGQRDTHHQHTHKAPTQQQA